ncbi:MAG: helix-turn-helix transcriptional regulator [Leptolyngbyaceae cyanobacterium MO_188.B28]|nr:helix-turn-helix transcriptional regulator [Leptolyngbyaceae cyanobacterium MO_188.B28]
MQADEDGPACSQIQQLLKQFKHALEQGGVISLASNGQVECMTPHAEHLLNQYFLSCTPYTLPILLQHWFKRQISQCSLNGDAPVSIPLQIERAGRRLTIRLIPDPSKDHYVLLLEEQEQVFWSVVALEEMLGLTKREAEVLFWIAQDKSNTGIAGVLGCCEGTVRKHLENIYRKLGVQSRMGAVMAALEKLGLLSKGSFVSSLS